MMNFDGFLPFARGSLMLDIVAAAMFAVMAVLGWSIRLAKAGKYDLHRKVQILLGVVLLVVVVLFELDMRFNGWTHRAKPSPYYDSLVFPSLYVHLFFALTTAALWVYVTVASIRRYDPVRGFGDWAPVHRKWAWLAALDMAGTAVSGWAFYYLAFVA